MPLLKRENLSLNRVYGLTGSIACGKSTVAGLFRKYGFEIISLDEIAKEVVKKGTEGLNLIVKEFGREFLNPDGTLNRKKLASFIFSDREARNRLERILHPLIFEREQELIKEIKKRSSSPIIVDSPLMIETGSYKRYRKVIVVYVPKDEQIRRLMKRDNLSYEEALKRVNSQMDIDKKLKFADFVVDNSKDLSYTEKQVKEISERLKDDN